MQPSHRLITVLVLAVGLTTLAAGPRLAPAGEDEVPVLRPAGDRGPSGDWPPVLAPSTDRDVPALTPGGRLAFDVIRVAGRFTDDAVGDAGVTPIEVDALRLLHREPAAGAAFLALARDGTVAGRLFGLCGLWYWDPTQFEQELARLLHEHGDAPVEVMRGCIVGEQRVRDVARADDRARAVRLESRTQTCREWFAAHAPEGGADYDIAGGGWPCVLRCGGGW